MSFIDWSDLDALFDMLIEYIRDEKLRAQADPARVLFLARLLAQLSIAQEQSQGIPQIKSRLSGIIQSVSGEFEDDPVMLHLKACLEELEREWGDGP